MNILFMGTPHFAIPSLQALIRAGHRICGVFTQPDKPKNRGMNLLPTPVKGIALAHDLPVFQPEKLRDGRALETIRALNPDLIVVAAYGRILPKEILECPRMGCINVHSSLLPKYRGAAPIQWAILNGDTHTGITIMHMAEELDAGDIIAQEETAIAPDETAEELTARLAALGASLLTRTVEDMADGSSARTAQDHAQATFAPMLTRALSPMDWNRPARALHNQVRGLIPWPAASAELGDVLCKVWNTAVGDETTDSLPGTLVGAGKEGIAVACGEGTVLIITELQAAGGKRMKAADYLRGHPLTL